ncbi:MAG: hypothetical protein ACI8Y4_000303 [Candidatus Poriferisodalaceae bacterium]|jgi:hypothetical protein
MTDDNGRARHPASALYDSFDPAFRTLGYIVAGGRHWSLAATSNPAPAVDLPDALQAPGPQQMDRKARI